MEAVAAGSMLLWSPINITPGFLSANHQLVRISFLFPKHGLYCPLSEDLCGNFTIASQGTQNTLPNNIAI